MAFGLTLGITLYFLGLIIPQCEALLIEKDTRFENKKSVASSRITLQQYSKIKCVQKCHEENTKGLCNVAGYNKANKTCHLSMDSHQDVLDVDDEMSGVYFMEQGNVHLDVLLKIIIIGLHMNSTIYLKRYIWRCRIVQLSLYTL